MNSLEVYFQGEYKNDSLELSDVESLLEKVLPTFSKVVRHQSWGYSVENGQAIEMPTGYSLSTNAMILCMLRYAAAKCSLSQPENVCDYCEKYGINKNLDVAACERFFIEQFYKALGRKGYVESGTYGRNDPFTLNWTLKLVTQGESASYKFSVPYLVQITRRLCGSHSGNNLRDFLDFSSEVDASKRRVQNAHALLALRALKVLFYLDIDDGGSFDRSIFYRFFEHKLHTLLSFRGIPDARFDPAELIFSLEGALLCGGDHSLSDDAIETCLNVIESAQRETPYWRPVNPLYSTAQGEILLPLSVEAANSVLRIVPLIDKRKSRRIHVDKHWSIFSSYYRWVKAQLVDLKISSGDVIYGWASEHVGNAKVIHTWQTAVITSFLIGYQSLLRARIASKSLEASGLKVDHPLRQKNNGCVEWVHISRKSEPLLEINPKSKFRIFKEIGRRYVLPRLKGCVDDAYYSMLLYGPPGTGKTTIAKGIAASLGWPLITVTPSDFIAGGASEVESRAKAIFKCLEEQSKAVVLFDEIDQFILDRESSRQQGQQDIFQFMTPGMLPKLQSLRDKKNCIFIIATNYAERIDDAIKRAGRIDASYVFMQPGYLRRTQLIYDFITPASASKEEKDKYRQFAEYIAPRLKHCTYAEIKGATATLKVASEKWISRDDTNPELPCSAISLKKFENRIYDSAGGLLPNPKPEVEFFICALIDRQDRDPSFTQLPHDVITEELARSLKATIRCQRLSCLLPGEE